MCEIPFFFNQLTCAVGILLSHYLAGVIYIQEMLQKICEYQTSENILKLIFKVVTKHRKMR